MLSRLRHLQLATVRSATSSKIHHSSVDAPELARRWGTSLAAAELTLRQRLNVVTDTYIARWIGVFGHVGINFAKIVYAQQYTQTLSSAVHNLFAVTHVLNFRNKNGFHKESASGRWRTQDYPSYVYDLLICRLEGERTHRFPHRGAERLGCHHE